MGFNDFLTKLFGNKAQRDLKEVTPVVNKIKEIYPTIEKLSHDELRGRTAKIRQQLQDAVRDERMRIEDIRAEVERTDLDKRESLYNEIDKLDKKILDTLEVELDKVLPEVFAIVKDTARRFAQNETIEVTATDFDRQLAIKYDFVEIDGEKAM
jgi:preprotein translocase subunit SecA